MNTPKHNGKTIKPGHYYGGGGGGGCYSEGFPIHLAGAREKPRKRGASVAFGLLLLVIGFAAGHAAAGDDGSREASKAAEVALREHLDLRDSRDAEIDQADWLTPLIEQAGRIVAERATLIHSPAAH